MYANVDKSKYKRVTSYSHSAIHLGRFIGGMTGQIVLSSGTLEIDSLHYLTLGGVIVALFVSIFLPKVQRSIYFHPRLSVISTLNVRPPRESRNIGESGGRPVTTQPVTVPTSSSPLPPYTLGGPKLSILFKNVGLKKRLVRASRALARDFKIAYTNKYVLKWSLWWSIAQAIYLQVGIYAEALWKEIEEETHESIYNGVIDASHAFLSMSEHKFFVRES
jgi:thiamine transporter 2/3